MTLYTFDIYLNIRDIIDCFTPSVFSNVHLAQFTELKYSSCLQHSCYIKQLIHHNWSINNKIDKQK